MQALEEDEGPASSPPVLPSSFGEGHPALASPVETRKEERQSWIGQLQVYLTFVQSLVVTSLGLYFSLIGPFLVSPFDYI